MSIVGYLEKSMETVRRRVSDHHDSCAGRTVEGMTGYLRCLLEDTYKKWDTLRRWVYDHHDGCAGVTVEGMTVRRRCLSEDTYKKYGDPQEICL